MCPNFLTSIRKLIPTEKSGEDIFVMCNSMPRLVFSWRTYCNDVNASKIPAKTYSEQKVRSITTTATQQISPTVIGVTHTPK